MKTLRIRKFMVIGMVSVIIFPWMIYFFIHYNSPIVSQTGSHSQLNKTLEMIVANSAEWDRPEWQQQLQSRLSNENMKAEILSPSNDLIFKSRIWRGNPWIPNQQFTVIEGGKIMGTVKLYAQTKMDIAARISAMASMMLAIIFVGYKMQKYIVKPLEAMSGTARRIAEGDLDLNLPFSRVTEIAEVRSGFEIMVTGLREAFGKQRKLEEERRFFIGAIAHDLRTPLFALKGYLDGLEQGIAVSPERMAKYVSVCKEKAGQLDRLVSDLFAFTKLEYMEQTLHREQIDFELILKGSIDNLKPFADEKGASIVTDLPAGQYRVSGDPHLLERAMNNLLDNALRHTPEGGRIYVYSSKTTEKLTISVRDTGPGFSTEDLEHVFEPLYRGEVSRNRSTGGAGLGLTIARRIFKAHGGDLAAANNADGGAVLTGWIPIEM